MGKKKMMLDKTVQWETHTLSGGVPVFGLTQIYLEEKELMVN